MAFVSGILSSDQITSLIQQASAAFQLPAAAVQTQEQPVKAQISALGQVQGALSSLQSAIAGLSDVQSLTQRTVATSSSLIVQASVDNTAAVGAYSLSNIQLASSESLISSGSSSSSSSLGSGSLAIQVGSGSAVTVNIASGASSLAGIAAAIDQADIGVDASVLFDGASYHLVLAGKASGAANAFTVSGAGALAGFSYHAGASGLSLNQAAADAQFSLNGISITSGSNSVTGVVPGLSLTLAGSGSATVTVNQSLDGLDGAAQGVVRALNATFTTINKLTAFSATSGSGPLLGNVGVELLRTGLLNALSAPIGLGGAGARFTTLSSVGFGVTSDGTVTLDDAAFRAAAQSDYTAVAALLGSAGVASNAAVSVDGVGSAPAGSYAVSVASNADGVVTGTINGLAASGAGGALIVTDPGSLHGLSLRIQPGVTGALGTVTISQGLFGSLSSLVDSALASGSGSVTGTIANLNTTVASMDKQIAALLKQASQQTQLLTAQFSAAQATLSQLNTVGSFLTTYFKMSSGGSGG